MSTLGWMVSLTLAVATATSGAWIAATHAAGPAPRPAPCSRVVHIAPLELSGRHGIYLSCAGAEQSLVVEGDSGEVVCECSDAERDL